MIIINDELLRKQFPGASQGWVSSLSELAPSLIRHYNLSLLDWRCLVAQIDAETDGLRLSPMRENMNFRSADRIVEVYSYRLTLALKKDPDLRREHGTVARLASYLRGRPTELANVVYGGREGTPWMQGSLYIGRGPTQITHKNGYSAVAAEIRKQPGGEACPDLVQAPEALESPEMGIRSAFADWHIKGLSRYTADIDRVSAALNTGSPEKVSITNGLDRRRRAYVRSCNIWQDSGYDSDDDEAIDGGAHGYVIRRGDTDDGGGRVTALQKALVSRGYMVGAVDGHYGILTFRAVVAFQAEHHLPPDGIVTQAAMQQLLDTAPADLGARKETTVETLVAGGSVTATEAVKQSFRGKVLALFGAGGFAGTALEHLSSAGDQISVAHSSIAKIIAPVGISNQALIKTIIISVSVAGFAWLAYLGLAQAVSAGKILAARVKDARTGGNISK